MRLKLKTQGLAVIVLCVLVFSAGALLGTMSYMEKLPVHVHFKCRLCHTVSDPTVDKSLNSFGKDFRDNEPPYTWNAVLAEKDSDNDGYTNGFEIGDELGDGIADISIERSNPGDPDNCPSSITPATLSIIKSLFRD